MAPSGRVEFAAALFYRVTASRDIFDNITTFAYDAHLSRCYADEYYSDNTVENPDGIAVDLQDTVLPDGLTPIERRAAVRALRGRALRVEVYGLDGSEKAAHPYSVAETNFKVRRLQPRDGEQNAAFFVHDHEALSYSYERDPADPRVAHKLVLAVDDFGNVLKSASVAYGRPVEVDAEPEQRPPACSSRSPARTPRPAHRPRRRR